MILRYKSFQHLLVISKKSSNVCAQFTTAAPKLPLKAERMPDEEGYDTLVINRQRKHIVLYKQELTSLIHKKTKVGLVQALKLFEDMKHVDKKKIKPFIYTLLITGCARNGYLDKAFQLFEEEKKRHLIPTKATIISLFNACAECPKEERDKALEKIEYLRRWMFEAGRVMNRETYNVLIKAYGKLGQLEKAYETADEMYKEGISLGSDTFSQLLVGCISDKEKGFGEAIKIFRRMVFHGVPRTLETYKLLLHAVKLCHIGSPSYFEKLVYIWKNAERIIYHQTSLKSKTIGRPADNFSVSQDVTFEYMPDGSNNYITEFRRGNQRSININKESSVIFHRSKHSPNQDFPNFLVPSMKSRKGHVLNIDYYSLKDPSNRLILIGGIDGLLSLLKIDRIEFDGPFFAQLLSIAPNENKTEDKILAHSLKIRIKLPENHRGLFNMLIVRRLRRGDVVGAKKVVLSMQRHNINVDVATIGALANCCTDLTIAKQFLNDLAALGIRPNLNILKILVEKACLSMDYKFIKFSLENFSRFKINPDRTTLDVLVYALEAERVRVWSTEKEKVKKVQEYSVSDKSFELASLNQFFENWCSQTLIEENAHPWDQFKYERKPWGYYKVHQYEKMMKEKILEREDLKEAINAGEKVDIKKFINDIYAD